MTAWAARVTCNVSNQEPADDTGRLLFRPDPRRVRRLAVFRRVTALLALLIVGGAIAFLLRYRPGIDYVPEEMNRQPVDVEPAAAPVPAAPPAPVEPPRTPADDARRLAGRVGDRAGRASHHWSRVQEFVPRSPAEPGDAAMLREELAKARAQLDSAAAALDQLRGLGDSLELAGRLLDSGRRFDVSGLQAAMREALGDFTALQRELAGMLDNTALAVDATASGDGNEAAIKADVAAAHRARGESRARAVTRRRATLAAAVGRISGW